jgi:hypothetical protein
VRPIGDYCTDWNRCDDPRRNNSGQRHADRDRDRGDVGVADRDGQHFRLADDLRLTDEFGLTQRIHVS